MTGIATACIAVIMCFVMQALIEIRNELREINRLKRLERLDAS